MSRDAHLSLQQKVPSDMVRLRPPRCSQIRRQVYLWIPLCTVSLVSFCYLQSRIIPDSNLALARIDGVALSGTHDSSRNATKQVARKSKMVKDVYLKRRQHMLASCEAPGSNQSTSPRLRLDKMYMDSKNGLVYCEILKAGSTFWKRVLLITSGRKRRKSPYDIRALADHTAHLDNLRRLTAAQLTRTLSASLKFMFVRDPYSRLFSCYVDKVFTPRPFYTYLRRYILQHANKYDDYENRCSLNVTFEDFVRYVVYSVRIRRFTDEHFVPMHQVCSPCKVQYDVIGKMESFIDDTEFILEQRGLNHLTEINREGSEMDAIEDLVDSAFYEKQKLNACLKFGDFLFIVWKKAIIRGILSVNEVFPSKVLSEPKLTKSEFRAEIVAAYERSLSDTRRLENRQAALTEAFRRVSPEDLRAFQNLFRPDFDIFDYDIERSDIFNSTKSYNHVSFFS